MARAFLGTLVLLAAWADPPGVYTDKLRNTPDLCQTDKEANFPGGGGTFCAPVAVSNGLMALSARGFPKLRPAGSTAKQSQIRLVQTLARPEFMDADDGAGPLGVMRGLKKYVEQAGYRIVRLQHQGWRKGGRPAVAETPELRWIKEGIADPSGAVFLNIGWYTYEPTSKEYRRTGGHWMTLAGYGVTKTGHKDPNTLLIHDPAPRTGASGVTQYVRVEKLTAGTLTGNDAPLPRSAAGFYRMGEGMVVKKGRDAAILDAVVVLVVGKE
jgi:hypothetical protein